MSLQRFKSELGATLLEEARQATGGRADFDALYAEGQWQKVWTGDVVDSSYDFAR